MIKMRDSEYFITTILEDFKILGLYFGICSQKNIQKSYSVIPSERFGSFTRFLAIHPLVQGEKSKDQHKTVNNRKHFTVMEKILLGLIIEQLQC
jgi:hypothetical protein